MKITMDNITKVYGHASLSVKVRKDKVDFVRMEVVEGARYFEGLLKGRDYNEVDEITSRICGTCSAAHSTTALYAVENALRVKVSEQTKLLRELLNLGALIQNQALHNYFFALPDYLGYDSALQMAKVHKEKINRALALKRAGNELCEVIGGRALHPIASQFGGFPKLPGLKKLEEVLAKLKQLKKDAVETAELFSKLNYPDFERKTEYVCLRGKSYWSLGHIVSTEGLMRSPEGYRSFLYEYAKPYTNSLMVVSKGKAYMVGPLSRINNNYDLLSAAAKEIVRKSKIRFPNHNPFINNFARSVELVNFFDRSIELLEHISLIEDEPKEAVLNDCRGVSALEAPRGTLFHEYSISRRGKITTANIITPTEQNLRNIEEDIKAFLPALLKKKMKKEKLVKFLEMLVRAYDPCLSCSTHFLEVNWI